MAIFPDAEVLDSPALAFMMLIYGYILMQGSKLIGNGSEMLLLLYGPGIIGGLLIPILGAVPDCVVILISGLGSGTKEEIQHQLSVGVGTLVGSTIMLITLPWAIGIYLGRRDIDKRTNQVVIALPNVPKVTHFSLVSNGVGVLEEISSTSKIMILSSLSYLIIQIPAFCYKSGNSDSSALKEAPFALVGVFVTLIGFILYCYYEYSSAQIAELTKLHEEALRRENWKKNLDSKLTSEEFQEVLFRKHDKDNNGYIDAAELKNVLEELGWKSSRLSIQKILAEMDIGIDEDGKKDNRLSLKEFKHAINKWIHEAKTTREKYEAQANRSSKKILIADSSSINVRNKDGEFRPIEFPNQNQKENLIADNYDMEKKKDKQEAEEIEEEEEEESYWNLSDTQLKLKACFLLVLGTGICTIFSDPMVDIISTVGKRMDISPFYISFVITPLASNASEIVASLMFARKKTTESISLHLSLLHGAATMNSTLALGIFMSLIYFRKLSWNFSAEVIAVLVVILITGMNSLRKTIKLWQALFVSLMYPVSILLVYILENKVGLD